MSEKWWVGNEDKDPLDEREYLTAKDTGVWEVTTMGSVHVFDFEHLTYTRTNTDELNPIDGDGIEWPFDPANVIVWPKVGRVFAMIFPLASDPTLGVVMGTFRMSSEIRSIRKVR